MEVRPVVVVTLWLDVGSEPLSGRVSLAGGPPESFAGWLELATLLERAATPVGPQRPLPSGPVGAGRGSEAAGSGGLLGEGSPELPA